MKINVGTIIKTTDTDAVYVITEVQIATDIFDKTAYGRAYLQNVVKANGDGSSLWATAESLLCGLKTGDLEIRNHERDDS